QTGSTCSPPSAALDRSPSSSARIFAYYASTPRRASWVTPRPWSPSTSTPRPRVSCSRRTRPEPSRSLPAVRTPALHHLHPRHPEANRPPDRLGAPPDRKDARVTILQAIVLGITQGITEFAPVSSSGHLILVPWLFGWSIVQEPALNKTFDVALHVGTLLGA